MVVLNWKRGLSNVTLSSSVPLAVPYQASLPPSPLPGSSVAQISDYNIYFRVSKIDPDTGEPTFKVDSDGDKIPYGYRNYKTDDVAANGTLDDDLSVIGYPPGSSADGTFSYGLALSTLRLGEGDDSFKIIGKGIAQTTKTSVSIEDAAGYIFQSSIFAGPGDDYISPLMPWQSVFKGGSNTDYGPNGLNLQLSDDLTIEEITQGDTIQLKGSRADWDLEFKDGNGDGSVTLTSILNEDDYIATSNNNRIYGFERLLFGDILFDLVLYKQLASNVIYGQPEYFLFGNEAAPELNSSIGADLWEAFRFNRTKIGGLKGAAAAPIRVSTGPTGDTPYLVGGMAYASLYTQAGQDILSMDTCNDAQVDTGDDDDSLEIRTSMQRSTLVGGSGRDVFLIGAASASQIELGLDSEDDDDSVEVTGALSNTVIRGGGGTDTLIIRGTFPDGATNKVITDATGTYYQLGSNRFYGFESITIANPPTPVPSTAATELRSSLSASEWIAGVYDSQNINGIFGPGTTPISIETGDGDNSLNVRDENGTLKSITNAVINTGAGDDVVHAAALKAASVNLGPGQDRASFTAVDNASVDGGDGDDTILLGEPTTLSAASIRGGNGNDTLVLQGLRSAWKLSPEYDRTDSLTGIRSSAAGVSSSVFSGFEIFQFNDWKTGENPGPGVKLSGIAEAITGRVKASEWERLGFDQLRIQAISGTSQQPIRVDTGSGANDVALEGNLSLATLATGAGNDTIRAVGASQASILSEAGNDSVVLSGALNGATLDTGAGSDNVELASATAATIVLGSDSQNDNDSVRVSGTLSDTVIRGGGGVDSLRIEGIFAPNTINRPNVTDASGTYYQLGSNRFYGFETITIVNPPLAIAPIGPGGSGSGGSGSGGSAGGAGAGTATGDTIIFGGMGRPRTLTGTAGRDLFQYNTRLGLTSGDTIVNFQPGSDRIWFNQVQRSSPIGKALKGKTTGNLLSRVSRSSKVAGSATVLVYNTSNGELTYNPNGASPGLGRGGGLIADFSPNVSLSNADLLFTYQAPLV